jgi:hypothetical protein
MGEVRSSGRRTEELRSAALALAFKILGERSEEEDILREVFLPSSFSANDLIPPMVPSRLGFCSLHISGRGGGDVICASATSTSRRKY